MCLSSQWYRAAVNLRHPLPYIPSPRSPGLLARSCRSCPGLVAHLAAGPAPSHPPARRSPPLPAVDRQHHPPPPLCLGCLPHNCNTPFRSNTFNRGHLTYPGLCTLIQTLTPLRSPSSPHSHRHPSPNPKSRARFLSSVGPLASSHASSSLIAQQCSLIRLVLHPALYKSLSAVPTPPPPPPTGSEDKRRPGQDRCR